MGAGCAHGIHSPMSSEHQKMSIHHNEFKGLTAVGSPVQYRSPSPQIAWGDRFDSGAMGLKYHTVIFLPHTRARFRKWRVSNRQLAFALSTLFLLATGSVVVTWLFVTTAVDTAELGRIRAENEELREVNESFETSIRTLQRQLSTYEERTRQLAIVAGLEGIPSDFEAGIGGLEIEARPGELSAVEARLETLGTDLERVSEQLDQRQLWISSAPAIAPVKGIMTSGFGFRRDPMTGRRALHEAIDIAAAPGQPVRATGDGIVMRAGRLGGLGTAAFISHGFGITTRYGHLARLAVTPGQRVRRGDVIGYVGSTGRSTGHHLHYEVQVDGRAVDPLAYILDGP